MRDWKKNPPIEKEIEAARVASETLRQRHGKDAETLFFAVGEQIVLGTLEGIKEFNSGKETDKVIKQCGYCEKFVTDDISRLPYRSFGDADFCSEECYDNAMDVISQSYVE